MSYEALLAGIQKRHIWDYFMGGSWRPPYLFVPSDKVADVERLFGAALREKAPDLVIRAKPAEAPPKPKAGRPLFNSVLKKPRQGGLL